MYGVEVASSRVVALSSAFDMLGDLDPYGSEALLDEANVLSVGETVWGKYQAALRELRTAIQGTVQRLAQVKSGMAETPELRVQHAQTLIDAFECARRVARLQAWADLLSEALGGKSRIALDRHTLAAEESQAVVDLPPSESHELLARARRANRSAFVDALPPQVRAKMHDLQAHRTSDQLAAEVLSELAAESVGVAYTDLIEAPNGFPALAP